MKVTQQIKAVVLAAALATSATVASAQDKEPIRFGLCFDLSKSYTFISPQVAQAAQDLAMYTNENGGIEGGFYFGGGRLQNSAGATQPDLVRQDGVVVDSAFMGSGTSGVSRQLSSDKFDPILNDDGANWCTPDVAALYGPGGTGDRGTPGAANRVCP